MLNSQTGHASPQFHAAFDDNFEKVDSLQKGIEPKRWKWLMECKNEYHFDDDGKIINGTRIWTDTELESSILVEAPKENQKDAKDSSATITPSNNLKNNNEIKTAERPEEEDVDRSRDQSAPTIKSKQRAADRDENKKMKNVSSNSISSKKISFQGVPKHNLVNVDTIGRRSSPRLECNRKKTLDKTLNHARFVHANDASDECIDQNKYTCAFKEAMSSPHKKEFAKAMIK